MSTYVWTVKDKSGRTVVREIQAETAESAKVALLAEGYLNPVLKSDEIMAAATAGLPDTITVLGKQGRITAEDRLKHRDDPTVTIWDVLRKGIKESKALVFLPIVFAIYESYRGHWTSAMFLIIAVLAWLAFLVGIGLPSVYYRKMLVASDWSRWNEVISLVATLQTIGRFTMIKVPATELTRNRTHALAAMGRLDEALAEYKQCEGRPDCPSWLYKLFVASLYTTAKQYDKAIEYSLASIAEKPTPTSWVDLANRYARYKRDPVKAREAMTEAKKNPMPDFTESYCRRCYGIISYLEGNYAEARKQLESAIAILQKVRWQPGKDGHLSVTRAYLCCVLAKQGNFSDAKNCFDLAKEYLVATQEDKLLAECRALINE